jgi:hypothetical protein
MTMKTKFTKTALTLAAACFVLPLSHANATAVDQCIETVATQVVPEGFPVLMRKDDDIKHSFATTDLLGSTKVFVTARGEETGKTYGRGTCVVSRTGHLVAVYVGGSRFEIAKQPG